MNQMQQDLQNELTSANQLLRLILIELQQIKQLTSTGGEMESNIHQNATIIKKLANVQQIDLEKIPSFIRKQINMNRNEDMSEQHNTFRNDSEMEES